MRENVCVQPSRSSERWGFEVTQRTKKKKSEESLCDLRDSIKKANIRTIGVPGEGRRKGQETYLKEKQLRTSQTQGEAIQVHEANRPRLCRHIMTTLSKDHSSGKNSNGRQGTSHLPRNSHSAVSGPLGRVLCARRERSDTFGVWKGKKTLRN